MLLKDTADAALDTMILSASGWRGVFTQSGNEEDHSADISRARRLFSAAAALAFAEYLENQAGAASKKPLIMIGQDTRPTGRAVADAMIPCLLNSGFTVLYAGFVAAPEIMAWAHSRKTAAGEPAGFIYISASHNPIGHNGLKFGLTDGGVLPASEMEKLISLFRGKLADTGCTQKLEQLVACADPALLEKVYAAEQEAKKSALSAYFAFSAEVSLPQASSSGEESDIAHNASGSAADALRRGLEKQPLGIVCDFNGSARAVSIDRDFFLRLGFKFESINDQPGQIVHRIVPEGESLEPCRRLLEEAHSRDPAFMLGYVPDCDGDRGNLVVWDESLGKARILEAQEVFALACVAELAHLVWTGSLPYDSRGNSLSKTAIAVNDPTSMRIDRIASAFDVSVFRAEVGEANVVGLARHLREKGYTVRILGEGSAGGNITHPQAVRDPLNTVLALAKLLCIRSEAGKTGFFELWCDLSDVAELYRDDFSLADIIASLPPFVTTGAYACEALLKIAASDHRLLKNCYQKIFEKEWEERKAQLKDRYGIQDWEAIAYNGMEERRGIASFGEAGKGGLKICFKNAEGKTIAFIWMRGSATEPVFRIMADAEGQDRRIERDLIEWQRRMTLAADAELKSRH